MRAVILAVGSELLGPHKLDTNSLYLTGLLEARGVTLAGKAVVPDDEPLLADAVRHACARAELVLLTGGLGPTADDVTRAAVADAAGRCLVVDERLAAELAERYARYLRRMPGVNRRQAEILEGATVLPNPTGTAPGQRLEHDGTAIFLFPGVPGELRALAEGHLVPWLDARADPGHAVERRIFQVAARAESAVEERLAPVYERFGKRALAVLASPGLIRVHAATTGDPDERAARLDAITGAVRGALGHRIFSDDEDDTLEAAVGRLLAARSETVALAESCTGGLVAEMLTRVPGSSGWVLGGVVAYANEVKSGQLGVDPGVLAAEGAVSEPVARAMAEGVRSRLGADWGIGVTGIILTRVDGDGWRVTLSAETVTAAASITLTEVTAEFAGDPEALGELLPKYRQKAMRAGG